MGREVVCCLRLKIGCLRFCDCANDGATHLQRRNSVYGPKYTGAVKDFSSTRSGASVETGSAR